MGQVGWHALRLCKGRCTHMSSTVALRSQNKLRQIFAFQNLREPAADIVAVDADGLAAEVWPLEADFLDDSLQNRVQPTGADVLHGTVHLKGHVGQSLDTVGHEYELHAFCGHQLDV